MALGGLDPRAADAAGIRQGRGQGCRGDDAELAHQVRAELDALDAASCGAPLP